MSKMQVYMVFSRKCSIVSPSCALSIGDLPLEKLDVHNYLGVYLTSDLSWSFHTVLNLKSSLACSIAQQWTLVVVDFCTIPTSDPTWSMPVRSGTLT